MAVKKNTIVCRFIKIAEMKNGRYYFDYKKKLSSKTYNFFGTTEQRKHLDIGSVVIIDNENRYIPHAAVIVDNITERNSKDKNNVIAKDTGRHLRGYIKSRYHKSRFAEQAYQKFKKVAHDARMRVHLEAQAKAK